MNGILAWDKKKGKKPNKTSIIQGVEASPAVKSAKEWFEMLDVDGSGGYCRALSVEMLPRVAPSLQLAIQLTHKQFMKAHES